MKTIFSIALGCFLFAPATGFSQYKHDIGIKLNTTPEERFQLEYRWHVNEKWSWSAAVNAGSRGDYYYGERWDSDSTYIANSSMVQNNYFSGMIGINRRFNFMKHNFYYAGAMLGGGSRSQQWNVWEGKYLIADSTANQPPFPYEPMEQTYTATVRNFVTFNSRLYLGGDFPILDRLSLNVEAGLFCSVESFQIFRYFYLNAFVTGGLRYSFGKPKASS